MVATARDAGVPLSPATVQALIRTNAIDIGAPGLDRFHGYGCIKPITLLESLRKGLVP